MRFARRLLHVLLVVFTLLLGTTTAAVIVSQTAWFKNRLRLYVIAQASQYVNGDISIEKLGGNLFYGLELEHIAVSVDGRPVVSIQDLGLEYNLFQLVTRGLSIDRLRVNRPVVYVTHDSDGWSLTRLIKKQEREADRSGPQFPLAIDAIGISDGSIVVDDQVGTPGVNIPKHTDRIDAQFSFEYAPVHYSTVISHVSFRATEPDLALNSLSGGIAVREDTLFLDSLAVRTEETSVSLKGAIQQYLTSPVLNVWMSSDKTSLPELANTVPALAGIDLQPAFELALSGPLERLGINMNARSSAGGLSGTLMTDLASPHHSASGSVSIRHLNLAPIVNDRRQASDITADAAIDLRTESLSDLDSLAGTVKVEAPRITVAGYAADHVKGTATFAGRRVNLNARGSSYGATATAAGRLVLPQNQGRLAFDLRGQARHVDVKALPRALSLPPASTDLSADYHAVGTANVSGHSGPRPVALAVDATFADSTVPGAQIVSGSTLSLDARAPEIAYKADAVLTGVDLQRVGDAFGIQALSDDRYKSLIDGHVTMEGQGTAINSMEATATGTIADASIVGGHFSQADFEASVAHDAAHVKAVGTFAELDLAVVSGKPRLQGATGGKFDVDASIDRISTGVTIDNVSGTARLALAQSTVGGLAIERGSLDADYRDQIADIRQLEVVGRDANLTAQGTLALGDSGDSHLVFRAESPRLAEIGELADVSVAGIGQVEGTITGNRSELQASGTLVGDGLTDQDNSALTLKSTYKARVPDFDFERAAVDADSSATFVKLAGQDLNEVTAKTSYADRRVRFEGTVKQPARSLDTSGSLLIHPDHQEVHLERLALATANQQWSMRQGEPATINYAHDTVAVEQLHLVSGDQEIVADGQLGPAGTALDVTMNNVDLAGVDALLLRPPQFSGRLNAKARIEGTREAPTVNGEFQVAHVGFRQFSYDSFGGTVNYGAGGVTVDARLQQNANQWITAKGYAPTALFIRTSKAEGAEEPPTGHIEPAAAADRIDLTIDSSPLSLGIVQGFTNEVTKVQGTVEAHVHVTGAADDPHPSGTLTVADGVMTLASTGVTYSNIAGRVDLEPDRVHIDQLTVLDNRQSALSLTGDLALHAREVGNFHLWITAEDFKIIDNAMGNLRVNSALELAGDLRAPEIRGDFGVSTGRIDLDELIARSGPSPYSTEPIAYQQSAAAEEVKARSPLDALRMKVRITVPDDLVINSNSLQAPGSAIGLGALNVTVGGDLTADKDPAGQIRLTGAVNTVRGTYQFQGRRFEILRDGAIRFDGLEEFDPRLDLRTHRLIQGVDVRVDVRGTLKQPEIALSSIPPQEDADILALIVFNQPLNQLGSGQQMTLVERASDLATGAVVGQLSQSIANALNLETFRFEVAAENGGGPAVTIGQQLGPNVYVKVQQGVGDSATTNLLIEYAIKNWLRLQTNMQQGASTQQLLFQRSQGTGVDLIFLFTK